MKNPKSKYNPTNNSIFSRSGDILCEMRFFVPNLEEKSEENDKAMKDDDKDAAEEKSNEEEEVEETPAKVMNDLILKHAGLGDSAVDIICSFHDLPL